MIKKGIFAAGTVALLITVMFGSLVAAAEEVVFEMDDPVGDDYGYGDYIYPLKDVFVPGMFDLISFEVSKTTSEVIFTFELGDLGGNPWGGDYNFSFQFMQVYIDNDRVEDSGRTDTLNFVNLAIDPRDAWEFALSIGPGWVQYHDWANQIFVGTTDNYVDEMDILGDNVAQTVTVKVPIEIIGEPTEDWGYAVILGAWDGGKFRDIYVEAESYKFGGADPDALIVDVLPMALDILVPEGMTQENLLAGYDADAGTLATIYAVPPPPSRLPTALIMAFVVVIIVVILGLALVKRRK